jgi:hypothetical protein
MAVIRYLKRNEIDTAKWDNCVDTAANGLIYGYSYYLDALCSHWEGFVLDDYAAVMPMPWRKKWGIRYIYHAPFLQRLGIYGSNITIDVINAFYTKAIQKFLYINFTVSPPAPATSARLNQRTNFIIDLNKPYAEIEAAYKEECRANITKAKKRGCTFTDNLPAELVIKLYRDAYGRLQVRNSADTYERMLRLLAEASRRRTVRLCGVIDALGNVIFGAVVFMDARRLYYIMGAPTIAGRQKRATYFFIDHILKSHASTPMLFDFEGSDLPNVAKFYRKFSPETEHYFQMTINRLPALLRWFVE